MFYVCFIRKTKTSKGKQRTNTKKSLRINGHNSKTLSGYENDVSEPDAKTLSDLATLYGVTTDFLTGRTKHLSIKEAVENKSFIDYAAVYLAALQKTAEKVVGASAAAETKDGLTKFKTATKEEQMSFLEGGFKEVIFTEGSNEFELVRKEVSQEVIDFAKKIKSLPEKERQALWEIVKPR